MSTKALELPKLFQKKALNSTQDKRFLTAFNACTGEKWRRKGSAVGVKGAGNIDMIFALLKGLLGAL